MRRHAESNADPSGDPDTPEPAEQPAPRQAARSISIGPRTARLPSWVKCVALGIAAVAFALGVRTYRQRQERKIVALSISRAERLLRADTWLGYHEAAALLGLRAAAADPDGAGSLRALALAMLALDYRDGEAATAARALVDAADGTGDPGPRIHLAAAVLALRDGRGATAVERLARAGDGADREVITARVALAAGNPPGASDPIARALAADARMPAALALRGDQLRRAGRSTEARDAYAAALKESADALAGGLGGASSGTTAAPHARSAFGLAKLALSRDVPAAEATAALSPLVDAAEGTPVVERARAGMYLAALQGRLGDRAAASATLQAIPVDAALRSWIESTVGELETSRQRYRVPDGTPAGLVSAADDDPYVPLPPPPPPPEPPLPKLHGFKVHGPARPARTAAVTTASPKHGAARPAAKKPAPKKKPAPNKTAPRQKAPTRPKHGKERTKVAAGPAPRG